MSTFQICKTRSPPLGPFPGAVSAELLDQTSRSPLESPVRMSPVLRKTKHWINFVLSQFCKENNNTGPELDWQEKHIGTRVRLGLGLGTDWDQR